jgi:hypothetical protein
VLYLLAAGCATATATAPPGPTPTPTTDACREAEAPLEGGAPPADALNAVIRAEAVLWLLRGCDQEKVARRYGITAEKLQHWAHLFVGGGRSALIPPTPATPGQLQDAFRGTWVLRSRIARGRTMAQADGVMLFGDTESLTVETGVLSDEVAEEPLGPQAGQPFRIAQYSRLQYLQREGSIYVVRMSSSELLGSYSDYPHGIRASLTEPFVRRGESFVHVPSPTRGYSPDRSDEVILLGDRMLIGWSRADVVDTWERTSRDPPRLEGEPTLFDSWGRLKRSRVLLEKQPARAAELLTAAAPPAAPAP